jgi:hypothetical protein
MPTTPYAVSSDLVSAWPAKSLAVAQFVDGYKTDLAMVQNAQTGTTYTLALTDFTKLVTLNNASPVSVTLPLESTVAWETGTQLRLLNIGAGTVTVAGAVGVTINGSPLTLTQGKGANLIKTGTNTWWFIPFASGVGAAVYSDANTGTYTGYAYKTFTASGTLTVTTAGFADLVIQGGGGRGGLGVANGAGGGGGAGGFANLSQVYLPAGTLTVTVGGASGPSRICPFVSPQGGQGGDGQTVGSRAATGGGSGGGGGGGGLGGGTGGTALVSFGFDGGTTVGGTGGASGGGGAGAVGVASNTSVNGGAGGAGSSTTIAGTTPTGAYVAGSFAFGGGGGGGAYFGGTGGAAGATGGAAGTNTGTSNNAPANLGGGGGGAFGEPGAPGYAGGLGGSGFIIVRVAV